MAFLLTAKKTKILIDKEDWKWLKVFKWNINKDGYARRSLGPKKARTTITIHRMILNVPKGLEVDHVNGNRLDNRRVNLRLCTHQQNVHYRKKSKGYSIYKGVDFLKRNGKWRSRIGLNNKSIMLGYFSSEVEAARVYNEAARKYHKEFAWLNKINGK